MGAQYQAKASTVVSVSSTPPPSSRQRRGGTMPEWQIKDASGDGCGGGGGKTAISGRGSSSSIFWHCQPSDRKWLGMDVWVTADTNNLSAPVGINNDTRSPHNRARTNRGRCQEKSHNIARGGNEAENIKLAGRERGMSKVVRLTAEKYRITCRFCRWQRRQPL